MFSTRTILTFLSGSCALIASAAGYSVKGAVEDEAAEPEAYATVRIFSAADSAHVASLGVTDEAGLFSQALSKPGDYKLVISSVGKKPVETLFEVSDAAPVADLGKIKILDNAEVLGEVEVIATRPLVVKEIDRLGYDVQADEDSKTSSVQEILRKVPMVTVESDGTIKVKGSTNFKIYKNGRPSNSFTNNAKDIFAAIPASMIKKIEVITDPGAKEDAEGVGAILNIVTVENASINGVMGNVRAGMMTNNDCPAGGLWLTGNVGKVVLSANVGTFHQSEKMSNYQSDSELVFKDSGNRQKSETSGKSHGNILFWGVDGSYELDSLNLFTMEFGGYFYDMKDKSTGKTAMFAPDGSEVYSFMQNIQTPKNRYLDFNGNFNYQRLTRKKDEIITLSYAISNSNSDNESRSEYSEMFNFPAPYSGQHSVADLHFIEHTLQLDWTRPINDHNKFSVGGKFIQRNNHSINDTEYFGADDTHDDFTHRTSVGAGYFDYRFSSGKWNARAGLRYEYSRLSAKFKDGKQDDFGSSLNDWVPNASVMYTINESSTFKIAYSSRINRPGITFLNPSKTVTPTSVSTGNPDLESAHHNSVSLNYSLIKQKFSLDLTASYDFANNTIAQVTKSLEDDLLYSNYGNVGRHKTFDLSAFLQWSITPKTSFLLNGQISHATYKIPQMNLENSRWGFNSFVRLTQQLPWKLRLEAMMFYGNGDLEDVYSYNDNDAHSIFHGFSLQRSFLKENRLTVKIHARNPFNDKMGWKTKYNRGDYTGYSNWSMTGGRIFGVEVSFRFGSVKTTVKKTAKSISNDDLQGGASAPSSGTSATGGM